MNNKNFLSLDHFDRLATARAKQLRLRVEHQVLERSQQAFQNHQAPLLDGKDSLERYRQAVSQEANQRRLARNHAASLTNQAEPASEKLDH